MLIRLYHFCFTKYFDPIPGSSSILMLDDIYIGNAKKEIVVGTKTEKNICLDLFRKPKCKV